MSASEQAKRLGLRQTVAEADLRAGLEIFKAISTVLRRWPCAVAAQEGGSGGTKSAAAAKGLARSQQACGDAVYRHLGTLPIMVTVQSAKKQTAGKAGASKDDIEAAVRRLWADVDLDALLLAPPPYLGKNQRPAPPGKWENAFDSLSVAHTVEDHAIVAAARAMAR